jgi:hypothetical protein
LIWPRLNGPEHTNEDSFGLKVPDSDHFSGLASSPPGGRQTCRAMSSAARP